MSTQERPLRKAIYAAVLAADGHSPLAPKSGDEELPGKGKDAQRKDDTDAVRPAEKESKHEDEVDKRTRRIKRIRVKKPIRVRKQFRP